MDCFQHQDIAAVAVCRNCFRGVCSGCAMPYADGVGCSQHCYDKAQSTTRVIENSVLAQRGARFTRFLLPVFFVALGGLFLAFGSRNGFKWGFDTMAGALFAMLGIVLAVVQAKYFKAMPTDKSSEGTNRAD